MEKMESQSSNSARKPIRRRSHTRKIAQGSVINMAEARREISHALHLHRSSSSSSSTCTKPPSCVAHEREAWMLGNPYNYSTSTKKPTLATSYCCYSLVEAMPMPLPEPVWSTTAPSVPAAPPGSEAMEILEWGGKQASSYTRWLGFVKENSGVVLEQQEISSELLGVEEPRPTKFIGDSDENATLDEWLMFPTTAYDN